MKSSVEQWLKHVLMLFVVLTVVAGPSFGREETAETGRFTNEAGNPIMAGDLDRVSKRSVGDSPVWAEGHRWEPARENPHPIRNILRQRQRHGTESVSRRRIRYFLLALLTGALIVRALLGWIVYRNIRRGGTSVSCLWIPVVLIAGTPGAIAYGLFRLSARQEE